MQIVTNQLKKELKEHGTYSFPFLVSRERLSAYESGSFLWHWHPEIELTLVTKGEMAYQVNGSAFCLRRREALFGNAGTLHTGSRVGNLDCEYISVTFDPKLIYGYENSIAHMDYVKPIIQNPDMPAVHFDGSEAWHEEAVEQMERLIRIYEERRAAYELDIISGLEQFWKLLFLHSGSTEENTAYDRRNYDRIRNILSYIEENYASKVTLDDIAERVHLCRGECCRIFKKYMKVTLFEFLLQYRIEKSIGYLAGAKGSITEIAESVGFGDSNYFAKVFRIQKGCSPSQYRKNCMNRENKGRI